MLTNYLKVALRNSLRNKSYTFINVFGMAVGIACFLFIATFVMYELDFDSFHKDGDRIYRVTTDVTLREGGEMNTCLTSPLLYDHLKDDFPDIEAVTRINPAGDMLLTYGDKKIYEEHFTLVDTSFFDVFDFEILYGDKDNILNAPKALVLTESVSNIYFGNENPIGETIKVDNTDDYLVTGVIKDLPSNSHINFNILAHNRTERSFNVQNWGAMSLYTYVKLSNSFAADKIRKGFGDFASKNLGDGLARIMKFDLQPMLSIHLYSDREHDVTVRKDINQIYLFSLVGVLILLIAAINFVNLSTARSSTRSLEIGVRKVLGATRKSLIVQHIGESFLLIIISMVLGSILFFLVKDDISSIGGITSSSRLKDLFPLLGIILLVLAITAGGYPAIYLSRFSPVNIIKSKTGTGSKKTISRKSLVILQFSIAIGLMAGTIIIFQQMSFINNQNLGYSGDQVAVIPFRNDLAFEKKEILKNEFLQNSNVKSVSIVGGLPTMGLRQRAYNVPDSAGSSYIFHTADADENYIETLGLTLLSGRNFYEGGTSDFEKSIIINETTAKTLGWTEPLGKELLWGRNYAMNDTTRIIARVIGVVKDFHFQSMTEKIEPLVIRYDKNEARALAVKLNPNNISGSIGFLRSTWENVCPNTPYENEFLDESFNNLYLSETRLGKLFLMFTCLAIIISAMGLFGLSAFSVERRMREIGVRKVFGASVTNIVLIMSKEFSLWILIANVIAVPLSFYIAEDWLKKFAYRIDLSFLPFLLSAFLAYLIGNFVVFIQTRKAALSNPVNTLREK